MRALSHIPKLFQLLLLLGFFQAITADSSALPVRERQPVAVSTAAGEPPGDQFFPDLLELPIAPTQETCGPPIEVVRVLAVPWTQPEPDEKVDRLVHSGLSPPLFVS